jgi:hypothetical protein
MMVDAAKAATLTGPASIDGVSVNQPADEYWIGADARRRTESEWASRG